MNELIEREVVLRTLRQRLRGAAAAGHVVLVAGEAGIGKTSVLRALASSHPEASVWWGACDALQTPHPLQPLHDIARDAAPRWRERLGGPRPALFGAVLDELRAAASPILLVVEDAHWADDATLDLIRFLARRIERTHALLVVSFRDDELAAAHPLRRVVGELSGVALTRLALARLSPEAVETLASRVSCPPQGLYAATHGNPFFVTELLRHDVDRVPPTVQALVLSRYARLGAAAQAIVRLASVVPARIERRIVDALLAPTPADLDACLDSGLLVADGAWLHFRHELARQAIEATIAAPHAQGLHAGVLAALEEHGGPAAALARLVHHATRAQDAAAVLRFAPQAGRQAAAQGAHREAAAHYASALAQAHGLDPRGRAELLDAHAYECYLVGDIEQSIAARVEALALWRALQRPLKEGDTLRWLSRLHWFLAHKAQADAYAVESVRVLEPMPPGAELAMAYSNQAQLHALAWQTAPAVQWGERAIALAERLGNDEILAHALNNVGMARYLGGESEGAQQLERSLALALANGLEEHAARAYCNIASSAVEQHEHARAAQALADGIAYCADHDLDAWSSYLLAWRAQSGLESGRWDEAAADASTLLGRRGLPVISRIPALATLGRLRARRGDPGADAVLDEALALALPSGELQRIWPVAVARAESAWLAGDAERCAFEARRGFDLAAQRGHRWSLGDIALWLWRCGALGGDELAGLLGRCAEPHALQMRGRWADAAAAWATMGCPFARALALADGDAAARREALSVLDRLGARAVADALRQSMRAQGERSVPRGPRATTRANRFGLTARQVDILGLVDQGLTNAQIGARRHLSTRTVDHHVAAILAKLGVGSRTAAARAAREHGLLAHHGQQARPRWAAATDDAGDAAA